MEDAKLEAYYNEMKASAPKGKTGGLGALRGPSKGGGFASAAQRSDAKGGRNAAKPAGSNALYKMFVKAGEGGFVSYDDDGNIIEEEDKNDDDDVVGLIPCMAKQRDDPKELKRLKKEKEKVNLKRKRSSEEAAPAKKKKADKKSSKEKKKDKVKKNKKAEVEETETKQEKKARKKKAEEAEVEAVLAAAAKVEAEKAAAASAVKLLSSKAEFDSCLKSSKKTGAAVLVDFSATWCGPCQSIAPVYAKLAASHPNAVYAKVDADENQESCDAAGVTSFPMFHVYSLGKKVAELDGADKKALKKLAKQYAEPVEAKKNKSKEGSDTDSEKKKKKKRKSEDAEEAAPKKDKAKKKKKTDSKKKKKSKD
jgi:thiol-disulfide isomerase/thioredoxin